MLFGVSALCSHTAAAITQTPLNQVIFTEIFPGNPSPNASQEFIELYNNTASDIDLTGWHVQYASATKTDWTSPSRNVTLSGTLQAGKYYLITSTNYLVDISQLAFSATLAQTGGQLRLLDKAGNLQDLIGWGNAAMALGLAVAAPDAGNSLVRLTNSDGFNLTGDNSTDFLISLTSTPATENIITLSPSDTDLDLTSTDPSLTLAPSPPVIIGYPEIEISELLPNPAAPQTDAKDEYVELYNPNNFDIDLTGFTIITGTSSTHKYVIKGVIISGGGYSGFYSAGTGLSLNNTTGKAALLNPDGTLADQTDIYVKAPAGQAWIFAGGAWVWTTSPTPSADNVLTPPTVVLSKQKTSTPKAKAAKKVTAKKTKTSKKSAPANKPLASIAQPTQTKLHPLVLAGVGSGALVYAMYEYRTDLAGNIYRLRRNREAWGAIWKGSFVSGPAGAKSRLGRWQNYLRTRLGPRFRK